MRPLLREYEKGNLVAPITITSIVVGPTTTKYRKYPEWTLKIYLAPCKHNMTMQLDKFDVLNSMELS